MNVWIVNPFDNLPVEGYRPQRYWLMSEAFVRAGHAVTFWTQDWSHAKKERRAILNTQPSTFNLAFVPVPGYGRNICLKRIWSHWWFARNWARLAVTEAQRTAPDLIVVSSPPLFIGREVRRFCVRNGAKYIVDIMDAWPETFERVAPRWTLGWMRRLVCGNYRDAAGITAVAKRYLDLAKSYGATCPMHLCYHGIVLSPSGPNRQVVKSMDCQVVNLIYIGNMSLSYDLATAIEAVKGDEGLSLDLAGAGPDEAALRYQASGCDRIRFHGYLDDETLRALLAEADVGLVPMFDDSCVGVPYKLADYVAAGLPVASSLRGETEGLLARQDAGVTYPAGDPAALREAVRTAVGKRSGVPSLAELFDARKLYEGYVAFATAL